MREHLFTQRRIPAWAIVLAVIFFACSLGLLRLMFQENVVSGTVDVTATTPDGFTFQTSVPIRSRDNRSAVDEVRGRVDFARSVVMRLQ